MLCAGGLAGGAVLLVAVGGPGAGPLGGGPQTRYSSPSLFAHPETLPGSARRQPC